MIQYDFFAFKSQKQQEKKYVQTTIKKNGNCSTKHQADLAEFFSKEFSCNS